MCGIVGGIAQRDVAEILVEGLRRLEYRGYDSAGLAVVNDERALCRLRRLGKVEELNQALNAAPIFGGLGIAHTRWATHGEPSERNAHPHISESRVAVVHNGIIENYEELRAELKNKGARFESDTDSEVIAHLIQQNLSDGRSLLNVVQNKIHLLRGAYGTVIIDKEDPETLIVARSGSPLVIGLGIGENFVASDQLALLPVTRRFIYLEEGDIAEIKRNSVVIFDERGNRVEREIKEYSGDYDGGDKGNYRHFMLKEIYEQANAVASTMESRIGRDGIADNVFGIDAGDILDKVHHIQIVACGTSYHSALVAKYWFESIANVSCAVEIASEFRYRQPVVLPNSLMVTISQSGETADTLAALRLSKTMNFIGSLAICNCAGSSLVRESDLTFLTRAGTEIGVASTKAFTTQLVGLALLVLAIGKHRGLPNEKQDELINALKSVPAKLEETLKLAEHIETLAEEFSDKHHALFLGRGDQYPIAMEGALKLKEISYIHAEAYAAGELKHGPLALIDAEMPVIVVAPNNDLLEKLKSNIEEVRARGGVLYVFADADLNFTADETMRVIRVPNIHAWVAPLLYTIPLQLLSYYVAIIKGTDVDQPRNLAKSVTVE